MFFFSNFKQDKLNNKIKVISNKMIDKNTRNQFPRIYLKFLWAQIKFSDKKSEILYFIFV